MRLWLVRSWFLMTSRWRLSPSSPYESPICPFPCFIGLGFARGLNEAFGLRGIVGIAFSFLFHVENNSTNGTKER